MAKKIVPAGRVTVTRANVVPHDASVLSLPEAVVSMTDRCLCDLRAALGDDCVLESLQTLQLRHRGVLTLQVVAVGRRGGAGPQEAAPGRPWYAEMN